MERVQTITYNYDDNGVTANFSSDDKNLYLEVNDTNFSMTREMADSLMKVIKAAIKDGF